jgi:hypothetical protein
MLPTTLRDGAYLPKRVKEEIDFDGPIERGAKKMRAQRVQEFLTLNGFAVSIDGDFGPATEKRVRDFQTARGLPATGIVDMKTHEELVAPIVKALNLIAAGGKSLSALAAAYAKQATHQEPSKGGRRRQSWPVGQELSRLGRKGRKMVRGLRLLCAPADGAHARGASSHRLLIVLRCAGDGGQDGRKVRSRIAREVGSFSPRKTLCPAPSFSSARIPATGCMSAS